MMNRVPVSSTSHSTLAHYSDAGVILRQLPASHSASHLTTQSQSSYMSHHVRHFVSEVWVEGEAHIKSNINTLLAMVKKLYSVLVLYCLFFINRVV